MIIFHFERHRTRPELCHFGYLPRQVGGSDRRILDSTSLGYLYLPMMSNQYGFPFGDGWYFRLQRRRWNETGFHF